MAITLPIIVYLIVYLIGESCGKDKTTQKGDQPATTSGRPQASGYQEVDTGSGPQMA